MKYYIGIIGIVFVVILGVGLVLRAGFNNRNEANIKANTVQISSSSEKIKNEYSRPEEKITLPIKQETAVKIENSSSSTESKSSSSVSENIPNKTEASKEPEIFVITLEKGTIYIKKSKSGDVVNAYTISEKMLPISDREKLYKGIIVKGEDALQQLIEDYTS